MPANDPKLMTIVAEALKRTDPAARATYLDTVCGEDADFRRQVEAMLATHDAAGRLVEADATGMHESTSPETLDQTPAPDAATLPPSALATGELRSDGADFALAVAPRGGQPGGSGVGQVIAGRYTLLEILGEGGMGTVYRASQTAPVKRQVALKLIKIGMDSRTVLARFDAERQALALMDHPNIARVFDGGTTEAGQPFFVMELVSGEPITDYCDRKRLPVKARLELFVTVCQAVQHAHQKGIIHRDLKPSNVLVTEVDGRPTPKVIDFGVAKATEFSLTDQSLADTGAIVGTPTYMSPEQADPSSMDIDTRTDVYALGVILYELLAGTPPLDAKQFKRGAILEMLRMVREVDPPKPSTKVSTAEDLPNIAATRDVEPAQLKRALKGDLDWIAMKALEKDRTRRYETANGLAADVLRHLAHEPVVAAPPSGIYRLRKFVRKHRGAVIAASLVVVSLLGGLGSVAAVQTVANARLEASLQRETDAKNKETEAKNNLNIANSDLIRSRAAVQTRYELAADAIKTFHTGVSQDFLLREDKFKNLRNTLLKSASDFYGKLGALLGKETDFASRRALAQSNFELAELTDKVGNKEAALAAHREVLTARRAVAAVPEADASATVEVGRSLVAVAVLLVSTGKTAEALDTYREAESLLASPPAGLEARASLASCRSSMAYLLAAMGKKNEALAAYRLARSDQEKLAAAPGAAKEARRDLADTINRIAIVFAETGKPSEAEAEFRNVLTIRQKLADDNPAVTGFRGSLAQSHINLGYLLSHTGKPSEAEAEYRKGMSIRQKLADDNPAVTQFRSDLADSHQKLGAHLRDTGKPSEAVAEFRNVLMIQKELSDDNPAATDFRSSLGLGHLGLGLLLTDTGKPSEAEVEYRKAMPIFQKLADDNPAVTDFRNFLAVSRTGLGLLLAHTGKPSEAEAEYRKAMPIYQKLVDDNPAVTEFRSRLATNHVGLGLLLANTGKPSEAEAEHRKALPIYQKLFDDNPKNPGDRDSLASSHNDLSDLIRRLGRPAEARDGYEKAIAIREALVNEFPRVTMYRSHLAWSLRRRGMALRDLSDPAAAAADTWRALGLYDGLPARSGNEWFETACCHAALAALAGKERSGVPATAATPEADKAMAQLRTAVENGERDPARYRAESALDPLRDREDFKTLKAELEKKSPQAR